MGLWEQLLFEGGLWYIGVVAEVKLQDNGSVSQVLRMCVRVRLCDLGYLSVVEWCWPCMQVLCIAKNMECAAMCSRMRTRVHAQKHTHARARARKASDVPDGISFS